MTLIQYIIVRGDLLKTLKWPLGAVITQCCHAVAAINELTHDDELTKRYLCEENLDRMHKCTLSVSASLKIYDGNSITIFSDRESNIVRAT